VPDDHPVSGPGKLRSRLDSALSAARPGIQIPGFFIGGKGQFMGSSLYFYGEKSAF
jgi:hypothetical protein